MSQDRIHTQSDHVVKKMIEIQKISEIKPESVFPYLETTESGLSEVESQARLRVYGDNAIKSKKSFSSRP